MSIVRRVILCVVLVAFFSLTAAAQGPAKTIAPGTKITMQNWRQYQEFMPAGMVDLFEGKHFWKMPQDVEMDVGPTIINPLPKGYLDATAKYGHQTKLVSLPNGSFTIPNYVAGLPFPDPGEPHKGWKVLANNWYRYIPHLMAATPSNPAAGCTQDRFGNVSCMSEMWVYRQLKHVTDPGAPMTTPGAGDKDYTEWSMVLAPEQLKYTAHLTIFYTDLTKPEDVYEFTPALRRPVEQSALARCVNSGGDDFTQDDLRYGFNGNITEFQAKYLGEKKILALTNYKGARGTFPQHFYMPLGWPKPEWGKWELRDVDVIDVRKVPSEARGYCYGKRIMYIDRHTNMPLWEDLYNADMKLWKVGLFCPMAVDVPEVGPQNSSGTTFEGFWDLINEHSTYFTSIDAEGKGPFLNQQVPEAYDNVTRYSTPGGLNLIMR
jgi:Protein of unknown function (DUF1329)